MAGASDYMVGNAPQGASYAAPLIGFMLGERIAGLPEQYFRGTQHARTLALQNAYPNGMPMTTDPARRRSPDRHPPIATSPLGCRNNSDLDRRRRRRRDRIPRRAASGSR
jgi:hypothetical protein